MTTKTTTNPAEMTRDELRDYINGLAGKTVVRKSQTVRVLTPDDPKRYYKNRQATMEEKTRGVIKGGRAIRRDGLWRIKLTVAWEGATNGAIRWNGSAWNTTSEIKIESLIIL
jgi:hypothetical protein